MRKRISRGPYYHALDPDRPLGIEIVVYPGGTAERLQIYIHHDQRTVDVNSSGYVLYGAGIDTARLMELVSRLSDE